MDWTPERVDLLTQMWRSGQSAREIAERLGGACTRNAVIGKANRLGLSQPTRSSLTRRANRVQREQVAPRPPLPAALPASGATILTLTTSACRWPLGDPGTPSFGFCGARALPGQPYCEAHARLAYQPPSQHKGAKSRIA